MPKLTPSLSPVALAARHTKGVDSLEGEAPMLATIPFDDALTLDHDWDAWFTPYHVEGASSFPRLNIPVVREILARGGKVLIQYFCIDWDNPDHAGWDADLWESFDSKLEKLKSIDGPLRDYYTVYTTAHGARVIYALEEPIPVKEAAGVFGGLLRMFEVIGIKVDPFDEWNRLFRLPRVTRDGEKSWKHDFFYMELPRKLLARERVPSQAKAKQHEMAAIKPVEGDRPTATEVEALIFEDRASGKRTHWWKTAKRYLLNTDYEQVILGGDPIPEPENPNLLKFVGSATGLLLHREGASPQAIYSLFYRAVSQWERSPGKEQPLDCLWRMVKTCWEREMAQYEATIVKEGSPKVGTALPPPQVTPIEASQWGPAGEALLKGWKKWARVPNVSTPQEYFEFFSTRMVAVSPDGNGCYVMQPNGYYAPRAVPRASLIAEIRRLGMGDLIQTRVRTGRNSDRWATPAEIINAVGYPVRYIRGRINVSDGAVLENIETEHISLFECLFGLNPDIEAVYDEEVDTWLQKVGGKHYHKLCEWLGHSLDFSHPICALFVEGDPGIGKKMIVRGLVENLAHPIAAGVREMTGRFQENLISTPFINCNEGFPSQGRGDGSTKASADMFRELIAGDEITLDRKNRPLINVQIPYRVLIFANNRRGVEGLYAGQDLTKEDRQALVQRLLHIQANNAAAIWLTQKGNRRFTAREHRRWIAGDAGEPSDYIVAQHFRWLYENRSREACLNRRFLVEGDPNSPLIMDMTLNSGSAPKVMTVLLGILSNPAFKREIKRITTEDQEKGFTKPGLYVTVNTVWEAQRTMLPPGEPKASQRSIGSVLNSMSMDLVRPRKGCSAERLRWYRLDCRLLLNEAEKYGFPIGDDVYADFERILEQQHD